MTHLGKDAGGHLTKHADGHLEKCLLVCPTDCSGCASAYVVSVVSISNPTATCFLGTQCSILNGKWGTYTRTGCQWTYNVGQPKSDPAPIAGDISCLDIGGTLYWQVTIVAITGCFLSAIASLVGNPCPPTGGVGVWTNFAAGTCSGQISVA